MKFLKYLKFIPFSIAVIFTILYSILLIGAYLQHIEYLRHPWLVDNGAYSLSIFSYSGFLYFAYDNYNLFMNLPVLNLLIFLALKILTKEIYLLYITLILIVIDLYFGGFCYQFWDPII